MENFVTADDKRIYDLPSETTPLLNMFLPIDKTGNLSARRISLQQIVNIINLSPNIQLANSGTVNPDNANGSNGDFYFKIPADGSSLTMFQKSLGTWSNIFTLPISAGQQNTREITTFTMADLQDVVSGNPYLDLTGLFSGTERPISVTVNDVVYTFQPGNDLATKYRVYLSDSGTPTDKINVGIFGTPSTIDPNAVPAGFFKVKNAITLGDVTYKLNSGSVISVPIGTSTSQIPFTDGSQLALTWPASTGGSITVYNSDGSVFDVYTLIISGSTGTTTLYPMDVTKGYFINLDTEAL